MIRYLLAVGILENKDGWKCSNKKKKCEGTLYLSTSDNLDGLAWRCHACRNKKGLNCKFTTLLHNPQICVIMDYIINEFLPMHTLKDSTQALGLEYHTTSKYRNFMRLALESY